MENLFDLSEKIVAVTGSAGVLAGGTAKYLQEQGAYIIYLDRCPKRLARIISEAKQISDKCCGYICDVLDQTLLDTAYEKIMTDIGRVDVLINGAGGNVPGAVIDSNQDIFDLNIEDYSKVVDLNLKGTVLPTMTFARAFKAQRSGCILNFSSMSATQALTRVLGYSNAKAAVDNFTKWMAAEMALRYGDTIRVVAVAPGFFIGNQNRTLLTNTDGSCTDRGQRIIEKTPFRRFGKPKEIFGTVHYLISDAAAFVTGVIIPVDGGFSAYTGV